MNNTYFFAVAISVLILAITFSAYTQVTGFASSCEYYDGTAFYGPAGRYIDGRTCDNTPGGVRDDATCTCVRGVPRPPPPRPAPIAPGTCIFYDGTAFYGTAGAQISGDTCDRAGGRRDDTTCTCQKPGTPTPQPPQPTPPPTAKPVTAPPLRALPSPQVTPPPTAPAGCSGCIPPGTTDCTQACRNIVPNLPSKIRNAIAIGIFVVQGTCAFPGSTNPAQCCSCTFGRPAAAPTPAPGAPRPCIGACSSRGFGNFACPDNAPFRKYIDGQPQPQCASQPGVPPCTQGFPPGTPCSQAAGTCVCP